MVEAAQAAADAGSLTLGKIGLRDYVSLPVICPTCQNVFAGKSSMPATPFYCAWGCFRYFVGPAGNRGSMPAKPAEPVDSACQASGPVAVRPETPVAALMKKK